MLGVFTCQYWPNLVLLPLLILQFGIEKSERIYDDMPDMDKIANVLQDYLDDYNLINPKEVRLVFFQDAIEHVSR